MTTPELTTLLKALADETRLKLLTLLLHHDLCVGALAGRLGISEAATSQHLQVLRKAGLVRGEKAGYWTHYSVQRDVLRGAAEKLRAFADRPPCPEGCCRKKSSKSAECCTKANRHAKEDEGQEESGDDRRQG
jgi:DNA-binding transcriptional ArsR family regulator